MFTAGRRLTNFLAGYVCRCGSRALEFLKEKALGDRYRNSVYVISELFVNGN